MKIMLQQTMIPSLPKTSILTGYYSNIEAVEVGSGEVGQGRGYRVSSSRQPARIHLGWLETFLRPGVSIEKAKGNSQTSMSLREPTHLACSSSIVVGGNSSGMPGSNSSSSNSSSYPSLVASSQQLGQQPSAKLALGWLLEMARGVGHTPLLAEAVVQSAGQVGLPVESSGVVEANHLLGLGVPNAYPHPLPVGGIPV
jgi:hypothetical protein